MVLTFVVTQVLFPLAVYAETIPDYITVVTDDAGKRALLGTTSEEARDNSILGLANEFSLFTRYDATFTGADVEGRVAVGGKAYNNTAYDYHVGLNTPENMANLIAQGGFYGSFALDYTYHTERGTASYYDYSDKKIAVIGSNTTDMDWSTISQESKIQTRVADLINFDREFDYLTEKSTYLANKKQNGVIIKNNALAIRRGTTGSHLGDACIFKGEDSKINIFTMNINEYNQIFKEPARVNYNNEDNDSYITESSSYTGYDYHNNSIIFDVPEGSKVVINILGEGTLNLLGTRNAGIYFRLDNNDELKKNDYGAEAVITAYSNNDFVRDSDGNIQHYKLSMGDFYDGSYFSIYGALADRHKGQILYNIPEANEVYLSANNVGSILAPKATVKSRIDGYLYGNIISSSYNGSIQIGYEPFDYVVKVSKIDSISNENVSDVKFRIEDLNGNKITEWMTDSSISTIRLRDGEYILKERKANDNYTGTDETAFTVEGSKVKLGIKDKTTNEPKKVMIDLGNDISKISTWEKLYRNCDYYVRELEFEIETNIDNLYYIVAANDFGLAVSGYHFLSKNHSDWREIKKWTSVEEGINCQVPLIKAVYSGRARWENIFAIHFYTSDGIQVTDQVTIKSIKAITYDYSEVESSDSIEYNVSENASLNAERNTIIVKNDHIKTTIELTKKDGESSAVLQGAVYEIQDANGNGVVGEDGNVITFAPTNASGISKLQDLRLDVGTYYLVEKVAPVGYVLSEERIEFTVRPHTNETIAKTVTDQKIKIKLNKKDEYASNLAGARFQLKSGNTVLQTFDSTNDVMNIEGLSSGTYTLKEIRAPHGFVKADDITFSINDDGKLYIAGQEKSEILVVNNTLKGKIELVKKGETLTDISNSTALEKYDVLQFAWRNNALADVIYELYAAKNIDVNGTRIYNKDQKIAMNATNTLGKAEFDGLVEGEYYVKEIVVDNGHELDTNTHKISLVATYDANNNQTLTKTMNLTNERKQETIELTKVEKGTTTPVKDAVYGLYNQEKIGNIEADTLIDVVTTNAQGKGSFNVDLPVGNYYVKEIEAPTGYLLSKESTYINFNETTDFTLTVQDDFVKVKINKTNTKDEPINGASLQILNKDGAVVYTCPNTDAIQNINKTLKVGETYTIKELSAPDGYVISENKDFTVLNTGDIQEINFVNKPTKVEIGKLSRDNKLLEGAALKLVKVTGNNETEVAKWTSGTTDKEFVGQLTVGQRYKIYEEKAPDGYATANPVEFTVAATPDIQSFDVVDDEIKVTILKKCDDTIIPGAKLELLDIDDNYIDSWMSTDKGYEINGKLAYGKRYKIVETNAPAGYTIAATKTITIADTADVQEFTLDNKATKVSVTKVDENDRNLPGATLQILDSNKKIVDMWETTAEKHIINNTLNINETYTLKELKSPAGYQIADDVIFSISNDEDEKQVVMKDKLLEIEVQKINLDGDLISGAELEITNVSGETLEQWTSSDETAHRVTAKLAIGETYILKETKPADGYVTAKDKPFTIADSNSKQVISMTDEKTKYTFAKYDENDNLVAGAKFEIIDNLYNSNDPKAKVDEWITENTAHDVIGKLIVGHTYTLKEITTPEGYSTSADQTFTVTDTGEIQTLNITNYATKFEISKKNLINGQELPGAELVIKTEDGTEIERWISTDKPHYIEGKLVAGEKYILTETVTPDGFVTAEPLEFTVLNTGKVQKISMNDDTTKVIINKKDMTSGEEIAGAELMITDEDGTEIESWTSAKEPHYMEQKLIVGKKYILTEVKPADGYTTAEPVEFTVEDTGDVQTVEMEDDVTKLSILKIDEDEKPVKGATLQLWDGEQIIDEWKSEETAKEFIGKLTVGKTYTIRETMAPDGFVTSLEKTFVVLDVNWLQRIEMTDNKTKVSISKQDITTGEEIEGATLSVETINGEVIEKWISTDEAHEIKGTLVVGETYKLVELDSPDGYLKSESILFKVKDTDEVQKIEMKDDYTKVVVEKLDEKGNFLVGAELQVLDTNENVVASWITDENRYEINRQLKAGERYILREIAAPKGYQKIKDIEFVVSEDGREDIIRAVDKKVKRKKFSTKTGDYVLYFAAAFVIAVGIIIAIIILKKKENKE